LRIVVKPFRQFVIGGKHALGGLEFVFQRAAALRLERRAGFLIDLQEKPVLIDQAEHKLVAIDALCAEHAAQRDPAKFREKTVEGVRVFRHHALAGVIETDSPQPQEAVSLGLRKVKREPSLPVSKSISVPIRNRIALGSMKILTPWSSITSSR